MKISPASSPCSFVRLFGSRGRRAASHARLLSVAFCGLAALSIPAVPAAQAQTAHFAGVQSTVADQANNRLNQPHGAAVDGSGNVYIADTNNNRVVKETLSGGSYTQSTVADQASNGLSQPYGLAVDGSGNVYITDGNNRVLKETWFRDSYLQSTVADQANNGLNNPHGIAVDASGNVYIADGNNNRVLKETRSAGGYLQSTIADQANNGLISPHAVAVDGHFSVYIADTNNSRVLMETLSGGTYTQTTIGSDLSFPYGVAVDDSGSVYIADSFNNRALKETPSGGAYTQTTIGSGLSFPTAMAADGNGNVAIVDTNDDRVVEVATAAVNFHSVKIGVSSISMSLTFTIDTAGSLGAAPKVLTAGAPKLDFTDAGTGTCTTNGAGHTYDAGDSCTVDVVFTPKFAGPRQGGVVLDDAGGAAIATAYVYGNGIGPQVGFLPATQIVMGYGFLFPEGVAVDGASNVYVADFGNSAVKEIPSGCVVDYCIKTLGGGFDGPSALAVDGAGNVYVADFQGVKKSPPGCFSASCVTTLSTFPSPTKLAVDGAGNVYVADSIFRAVKEIPSGCASSGCVTIRAYDLYGLAGLAIDGRGNIYVNDSDNNLVKELSPSCTSGSCASTLGGGFNGPGAVAVDASGNVYAADYGPSGNSAIKEIPPGCTSASCVITLTQSQNTIYLDVKVDSRGDIYLIDNNYSSRVMEEDVVRSPFLTFATTPAYSTSSDSPQTVTLQNIGTAPLRFLVPASGMNPSVPANFSLDNSSTCPQLDTSSYPAALPSGKSCTLLWSFTPTIVGSQPTEMATITDNSLNVIPSTQTIDLNGTATQATQTITFSPIPPQVVGHSVSLVASAGSGLPVSFQSLTPSVCTVSGTSVTAIAAGTCTIQATQAGNGAYAAATPVSQNFTVN